MNREDVRNLVISNTSRRDKAALINTAISLVMAEITQIHEFRTSRVEADLTLSASTQTVILPSDVFQLLPDVRLLDSTASSVSRIVPLKEKTWILQRYPNLGVTVESWPAFCFVDDESGLLTFVPISAQDWTVRIEYHKLFVEVTSDATIIDRQITNAVISWATAYVFRSIQMFTEAREHMAEYARSLQIAIAADSRRHSERTLQGFSQGTEIPVVYVPPHLDPFNNG